MNEPNAIHSTFTIERQYTAAPGKVFAAFAEPASKRRWFFDTGGNEVQQYDLDFRDGGTELAQFRFKPGSPVAGLVCVNESKYLDILPDRRIVMAATMTIGGRRISAALITVDLIPSERGTDLLLTHQGAFFEGADGPDMRKEGWRKLIDNLNAELEP
jgi:uncharacterized protein YndB with AHSA1/START domain